MILAQKESSEKNQLIIGDILSTYFPGNAVFFKEVTAYAYGKSLH